MQLLVILLACADQDERVIQHYEPPFTPVYTFSDEALVLTGGYADPSVVQFESRYAMYVSLTEGEENGTVVYASPDLLTWTQDPRGVVLKGVSTGRGVAMDDGVRVYYPSTAPVADGTRPSTSSKLSLYSAWSNDTVHFVDDPGLRATSEVGQVGGPAVMQLPDETWRAWYHIASGSASDGEVPSAEIWSAASENGLDWDLEDEPILVGEKDIEGVEPTAQVLHPFVARGPDAEGNTDAGYWMFYNAHAELFAAWSADGLDWQKLGAIGLEGADFAAVPTAPGEWRIWYGRYAEDTLGEVYTSTMTISISN